MFNYKVLFVNKRENILKWVEIKAISDRYVDYVVAKNQVKAGFDRPGFWSEFRAFPVNHPVPF